MHNDPLGIFQYDDFSIQIIIYWKSVITLLNIVIF